MKFLTLQLMLLSLLLTGNKAAAPAPIDAALKTLDDTVAQKTAAFEAKPRKPQDKEWVKARLAQMIEIDQYARKFHESQARAALTPQEDQRFMTELGKRWAAIDTAHTVEVKSLLKRHGWFTISTFGEQADHHAWLLVQHADHDPAFQQEVLGILEKLYAKGETNKQNYAYLYDRVALSAADTSKRRPQRYGTQGQCIGKGLWEPHPVEDGKNLDARRAALDLSTIAEYKKVFKDICQRDERTKA